MKEMASRKEKEKLEKTSKANFLSKREIVRQNRNKSICLLCV